jgi:hypothetical protein
MPIRPGRSQLRFCIKVGIAAGLRQRINSMCGQG